MIEVTEVRIKPVHGDPKLKGFANVTIDDSFVVRDCKLISKGRGILVSMPSRRITDRCPTCDGKNALAQRYCGDCGARLADGRGGGPSTLYADIVHPTHNEARHAFTEAVLAAYWAEVVVSGLPGIAGRVARLRA